MNINDLWHSSDPTTWEQMLQCYWNFVQPRNIELEKKLDSLSLERIRDFNPQSWYDFLHDEYFRWKYTAPNRYTTTTLQLQKYIDNKELDDLDKIRLQILNLDPSNVLKALRIAQKIRGLGTAGASGLLSLIYPLHFATVDQFVVKALRLVKFLPEAHALSLMNPANLNATNGALLIGILSQKAQQNNLQFETSFWTARKIDMILWTSGR